LVGNQKVLFVGVGTGADLELIDLDNLTITAIDYSDDMLNKAKEKFKGSAIQFNKMDAQDMNLRDNQFDVVVASLVLSVVPDADRCLKEMLRVLKPSGEVLIFDKFAPKDKGLSQLKKAIRPIIKLLGTDIGINFEELCERNRNTVYVKEDTSLMFSGMYRKIVLGKINV
jgi:phosphatidylethanolamine/phosphatidyl-N-methylethanolamine N-methyltransferase